MNSWLIRSNAGMIPGGVIYEDPRTPEMKWLDSSAFLDERTRQVIAFRRANPTIYSEPDWTEFYFVRAQIALFNCERLNFNSQFCFQVGPRPPAPPPPPPRTCPDCGVELVPKYCSTCAGKRILAYTCPKCSKEYPK